MQPPRRLAAAFGLSAATWGALAEAAPPGPGVESLPVLEIATDDADEQAKALTQAIRSRVKASTQYSLADQSVSLQVLLLSLKCPDVPDAMCQEKIAGKIKSDRYIWGTMKKGANKTVVADLHLYVKGRPDQRQQFTYAETMTDALDAQMQKQAESMFLRVTQFGRVGVVRLGMETPMDGEVFANGQSIGNITQADHEYTLPVGETVFEVRSAGKVIARGQGTVLATAPIELKLTDVKDKVEGPRARSGDDAPPAAWKRPASYAAVGVGAVFLGLGALRTIQNITYKDSAFVAYRDSRRRDEPSDACARARAGVPSSNTAAPPVGTIVSQCDAADGRQVQQYVFYITGGVLVAAGGLLYYTTLNKDGGTASAAAAAAKRVSLDVAPVTTPTFKGVAVQGTF